MICHELCLMNSSWTQFMNWLDELLMNVYYLMNFISPGKLKCATTIIGEDTDILVLLCFHWELASFPIYFQSEIKRSSKHISVWNINGIKTALGPSVWSVTICPCNCGMWHYVTYIWHWEGNTSEEIEEWSELQKTSWNLLNWCLHG